MTPVPRAPTWLLGSVLAGGLAVAVLGGVRLADPAGPPMAGEVPSAQVTRVAGTAADGRAPARLWLPDQRVNAPIVPVDIRPDGSLDVPEDPRVLGWWRGGAWPGAPKGTVVVDGHVDTRLGGPGALFRLTRVTPGATIWLATPRGELRYVVRAVRSYPKTSLPAEVFDVEGAPRLALISCGGRFNEQTRQYSDNVIAYATPEPAL